MYATSWPSRTRVYIHTYMECAPQFDLPFSHFLLAIRTMSANEADCLRPDWDEVMACPDGSTDTHRLSWD